MDTNGLAGIESCISAFPMGLYISQISRRRLLAIYCMAEMWAGAKKGIEAKIKPARHAFRQGFIINALNPKAMLFAAAVLIVIFPANMTFLENATVVFNHLVIEVVFYTALAFGMSAQAVSRRYMKAKTYIDRTASVILGALGLRLLVTR